MSAISERTSASTRDLGRIGGVPGVEGGLLTGSEHVQAGGLDPLQDGQVVDALLTAEFRVVVISPNQVKSLRSRYGQAGTRTTGSTRSCWPTRCAPTGPGCGR